jgi:hypothetical protein
MQIVQAANPIMEKNTKLILSNDNKNYTIWTVKQEYEKLYKLNSQDNNAIKRIDECDSIINAKAKIASLPQVYEKDKIYGKFPQYTDYYNIRLAPKEIKNRLKTVNLDLKKDYQRARTQRTFGHIILFTGLASSITGVPLMIIGAEGKKNFKDAITEDILFRSGFILTTAGIAGTFFVSVPILSYGNEKVKRTIQKYNNQIGILLKNKPTAQLNLGLSSSGTVGLALKF